MTRTFFCKTKLAWYREKYSLPCFSLSLFFHFSISMCIIVFEITHVVTHIIHRSLELLSRNGNPLMIFLTPSRETLRMRLIKPRLKSPYIKLRYNSVTNLLEGREKEEKKKKKNIFKRLPISSALFHSHLISRRRYGPMLIQFSPRAWSADKF